ncbi:MAG: hypothetical protein LUF92_12570 [Clostridiales bacterium]|nr:hypothetical protein [Clostridiales bacterium]
MEKEIQMGKDVVITDELREKFRLNEDLESEEPIRKPVRWRCLFPASVIKQASGKTMQSKIRVIRDWSFLKAEYYPDAKEKKAAGISSKARISYNSPYYSRYSSDPCFSVTIGNWPLDINTDLEPSLLTCGCPEGKKGGLCCHEAAVLYYLEQQNGGLIVAKEGEYASRERIRGIKQRKKHKEQERLWEKYGLEKCPVLDFFKGRKDPGGIAVYDMRTALKDYVTDPYSMHMAKDILENHPKSVNILANEQKDRDGTRTYRAELTAND